MSVKQKSESLTEINGTPIEAGKLPETSFEKAFAGFEPEEYHNIKTPFGFFDYQNLSRWFVEEAVEGDTIVEIGSWVGKSTCYMGELVKFASENGKKVKFVNIDPFIADCTKTADGYGWIENSPGTKLSTKTEFYKNIEPVKDYVRTIEDYSVPASEQFKDESLFAVWVDGHHGYESVLADMEAFWKKIRKGGILAGHDYVISGAHNGFEVARAVETFAHKYDLPVLLEHKSWIIRKV